MKLNKLSLAFIIFIATVILCLFGYFLIGSTSWKEHLMFGASVFVISYAMGLGIMTDMDGERA